MKIKEVMSKDIITVRPNDTLFDVARLLFKHQISGVLVVNEYAELIGVLSEKDLYRALYPNYRAYYLYTATAEDYMGDIKNMIQRAKEKKVKDVMNKNIVSVSEKDLAIKAGALMLAKHINRLPVLNDKDKLVGIVSRRDIYQKIFKKEFGF